MKPKRERPRLDPEFAALQVVTRALIPLAPVERSRILRYVAHRLGITV